LVAGILNGSGSSDADGDSLTYSWTKAGFSKTVESPSFSATELGIGPLIQSFMTPIPTAVEQIGGVPSEFSLDQNYPNPFNSSTTITFALKEDANITLKVFDLSGQMVRALETGHYATGTYKTTWDGLDEHGQHSATGHYFYSLEAGENFQVRKMILLR